MKLVDETSGSGVVVLGNLSHECLEVEPMNLIELKIGPSTLEEIGTMAKEGLLVRLRRRAAIDPISQTLCSVSSSMVNILRSIRFRIMQYCRSSSRLRGLRGRDHNHLV